MAASFDLSPSLPSILHLIIASYTAYTLDTDLPTNTRAIEFHGNKLEQATLVLVGSKFFFTLIALQEGFTYVFKGI